MTTEPKADFSVHLSWKGEERFQGTSGDVQLLIDGKRKAGPSPVQGVAFSLGSCMAIDVADILEKGRFPLRNLECDLTVFREKETPRRITAIDLHFTVGGAVPEDRVARAIELSREKYCSVWHSLNPSIDFKTSFAVNP